MYDITFKYQSYIPLDCLVWWGVITWPIGWSDPFSIWCATIIFLFPYLVYLIFYVFNIFLTFTFIKFTTWCLWYSGTMFINVISLHIAKACDLTQPYFVVTTEVFPNTILRNMSIFLTIIIAISCIIIPIIRVAIVPYPFLLVWWPCWLGSTFKISMSILLTVIAISFKSWCMHDSGYTFMCLMTLLVALMMMDHVLRLAILICILAPAHISSMSFLSTIMTSGFGVLTFVVPFFSSFGWFSFFSTCVAQS